MSKRWGRAVLGLVVSLACLGLLARNVDLSDVARELARQMGVEVEFVTEPDRLRRGEPALVRGSHRRFTERTGWNPACGDAAQLVKYFLAD